MKLFQKRDLLEWARECEEEALTLVIENPDEVFLGDMLMDQASRLYQYAAVFPLVGSVRV